MGRDKDARAPRIPHPDESVDYDVGRSYFQQIAKTVIRHPTNKSDGNRLVYGLSKMIDVVWALLDGLIKLERPIETKAHPPTLDTTLYLNSEIGVLSIILAVPVWSEELIKGCQADRPFCAGCVLESGPPASFDGLFFQHDRRSRPRILLLTLPMIMGESRETDFHPRMKLLYTTGITFWCMASFWNLEIPF
jgi:hypothetical protein